MIPPYNPCFAPPTVPDPSSPPPHSLENSSSCVSSWTLHMHIKEDVGAQIFITSAPFDPATICDVHVPAFHVPVPGGASASAPAAVVRSFLKKKVGGNVCGKSEYFLSNRGVYPDAISIFPRLKTPFPTIPPRTLHLSLERNRTDLKTYPPTFPMLPPFRSPKSCCYKGRILPRGWNECVPAFLCGAASAKPPPFLRKVRLWRMEGREGFAVTKSGCCTF